MATHHRTAYPTVTQLINSPFMAGQLLPDEEDVLWGQGLVERRDLLTLMVLFKTAEQLGYMPTVEEIPSNVADRIYKHLFGLGVLNEIDKDFRPPSRKRLYERFRPWIRQRLGWKHWSEPVSLALERYLTEATQTHYSTKDLVNAAIEWLWDAKVELPALSTLKRVCGAVNIESQNQLHALITSRLDQRAREALDDLLVPGKGQRAAAWTRIRERPEAPSVSSIRAYLSFADWIWSHGNMASLFADIPKPRIRHLSAQAREQLPSDLANFHNVDHRHAIMAAAIFESQQIARDTLAHFFCRRMQQIEQQAQEDENAQHIAQRSLVVQVVTVWLAVLEALKERNVRKLFKTLWRIITAAGSRESLMAQCRQILDPTRSDYFALIYKHFRSSRTVLFEVVHRLPLRNTAGDPNLLAALALALKHLKSKAAMIPADVDLSWASDRWRNLIVTILKGRQRAYNHDAFEVAVCHHLADALKSGDVAILGASEYSDYRDDLLSWAEAKPQLPAYGVATGIPTHSGQAFANDLKDKLEQCIARATKRLVEKPLPKRVDGKLRLPKFDPVRDSESLRDLERLVHGGLKSRSLMEILVNADLVARYTHRLGPPAGSAPRGLEAHERLLVTLFAYGTGLGPSQVVKHLQKSFDPNAISYANRHHFSSEQLAHANADVVNAINGFPISALYGSGLRAGVDGSYLSIRESTLLAEFHFRYRAKGGIRYQLISDKFVALFSTFIPCSVYEATHLLDLVFGNRSKIKPSIVHGDTHSQSAQTLGLAYLLGIDVRPRIRNWKQVILFRPDDKVPEILPGHWRGTIDWELIASQFQDLMRVIMSIQKGRIVPSNLIKHLGTYSRRNRLYQALREIGRVIRTMIILDYVSDENEQRAVSKMTNTVESYNRFCNWFVIGDHGPLKTQDPDEFDKRIKQRDLLANCAILQTMIDLTAVLRNLHDKGYAYTRADAQRITPYITEHIKRFGEFTINLTPTIHITDDFMTLPPNLAPADST